LDCRLHPHPVDRRDNGRVRPGGYAGPPCQLCWMDISARKGITKYADVALRAMMESAANLPDSRWKPDVAEELQNRLEQVGDAVSARQRLRTMDFANGITRLVADLSEEDQPAVPYALVLLGYYGRELEVGIAAGDHARLKRAVDDLQQTWNKFERIVLQHGAVDEARRFTDIVAQLEGATTPSDFVGPTGAELDAVVRLKKIF
jgi:hypothetical protein